MKVEEIKEKIPKGIIKSLKNRGIEKFTPPQEESIKSGLLEGESLTVSSPTASGKTLVASLAFLKNIIERDGKAVYIVPLRSLASEKYKKFKKWYRDLGVDVAISIGNYDSADPWLSEKDLIIATSEKLDSLIRHGAKWIKEVNTVVIDEIHLLNDKNRGPNLEVLITRLKELIPNAQYIALSATINNDKELADWLDSKLIESSYRPVELKEGVYFKGEVDFKDKKVLKMKGKRSKPVQRLIQDTLERDKQALVFLSTRRSTESVAKKGKKIVKKYSSTPEKKKLFKIGEKVKNALEKPTSQCKELSKCVKKGIAFHHAGLCLPYDAKVQLADGRIIRIGELVENHNDKELEVLSLNTESLKFETKPVTKFWKLKAPSKLVKITTRSGKKITITLNHPLLVKDRKPVWKQGSELEKGDHIAMPRKIETSNKKVRFFDLLPDWVRVLDVQDLVQKLTDKLKQKYDCDLKDLEKKYELPQRALSRYRNDQNISLASLKKLAREVGIPKKTLLENVREVTCKSGHGKGFKVPKFINKEFLELVGFIAADGHNSKYTVSFTNKNKNILRHIRNIIEKLFGTHVSQHTREDGLIRCSASSKVLATTLKKYFGIPFGEKSDKIKIPSMITQQPNDLIAGFIKGCFEGDSGLSLRGTDEGGSSIEYTTTSKEFANKLRSLLLRFGIRTSMFLRERKSQGKINPKKKQYRVFIGNREGFSRFSKLIGYQNQKNQNLLRDHIASVPESFKNCEYDVIPNIGSILRRIKEKLDLSYKDISQFFPKITWWRWQNNKNPSIRKNLKKLVSSLEASSLKLDDISEEMKRLKKLVHSDILWEKVKEIKIINNPEKWVYDLSVKGNNNFIANGIVAHNTTEQKSLIEKAFRDRLIKVICCTPTLSYGVSIPADRTIVRDLKRFSPEQGRAVWIPVLEYQQFCGRAGRPEYSSEGEAITVAKKKGKKDEIEERYLEGEPEDILSKLAVKPILRMHILALIASNFTRNREQLKEFFSKTLYWHQYEHEKMLENKIGSVLQKLISFNFVESEEGLKPTKIGKRVSELYIDPLTGKKLIDDIKLAKEKELTPFSLLFMISNTLELQPWLKINKSNHSQIESKLAEKEDEIIEEVPNQWDYEYQRFLKAFRLSLMLKDWMNEMDEEKMMKKYGVAPGSLRSKLYNADWLLYSSKELANLLGVKSILKELTKLRLRMKKGVREELLNLVRLDQIGRVRARKLYKRGIKDTSSIKKVPYERLSDILGPSIAAKVKEQVGENVEGEKERKFGLEKYM